MNGRLPFLSASALVLLLAASQATAADDEILDAPEVVISAAKTGGTGFYLRGDIGYAGWTHEGTPSLRVFDAGSGTYDGVSFDDARFGKPFSGALGIGYQFNDMIRADVTTDYFEGRFEGAADLGAPCAGEAAGTSCEIGADAPFKAVGLMANAYADLGTLAGFTPYIGGGLGATHLRWSDATADFSCIDGTAVCSGGPGASVPTEGEDGWRFTYALMAGLSYDVSERLKIDVGYRYSHIASGDMFGGGGVQGRDEGFGRHEVRAGLRLSLW